MDKQAVQDVGFTDLMRLWRSCYVLVVAYGGVADQVSPWDGQVVQDLGTADIDARLEELLIDGILYAFQEQVRSLAAKHSCCCTFLVL